MIGRIVLITLGIGLSNCALGIVFPACSVVNPATYQQGIPNGGALATMFCTPLGATPGLSLAPNSPSLPFTLAGVTVEVNQSPAPILAVYATSQFTQINFQIPPARDVTGASPVPPGILVRVAGNPLPFVTVTGDVAPGLGGFFSDANGYAIAQHVSDKSPVTLDNPAHAGETVIVYANDFYQVWPPPPIGVPVPTAIPFQFDSSLPNYDRFLFFNLFLQDYPTPTTCPGVSGSCSIARTAAVQILSRTLAAGQIGVEEIHFVVPANKASGNWDLFFNAGSCTDGSGLCALPCPRTGCSTTISSAYVKLPVR